MGGAGESVVVVATVGHDQVALGIVGDAGSRNIYSQRRGILREDRPGVGDRVEKIGNGSVAAASGGQKIDQLVVSGLIDQAGGVAGIIWRVVWIGRRLRQHGPGVGAKIQLPGPIDDAGIGKRNVIYAVNGVNPVYLGDHFERFQGMMIHGGGIGSVGGQGGGGVAAIGIGLGIPIVQLQNCEDVQSGIVSIDTIGEDGDVSAHGVSPAIRNDKTMSSGIVRAFVAPTLRVKLATIGSAHKGGLNRDPSIGRDTEGRKRVQGTGDNPARNPAGEIDLPPVIVAVEAWTGRDGSDCAVQLSAGDSTS